MSLPRFLKDKLKEEKIDDKFIIVSTLAACLNHKGNKTNKDELMKLSWEIDSHNESIKKFAVRFKPFKTVNGHEHLTPYFRSTLNPNIHRDGEFAHARQAFDKVPFEWFQFYFKEEFSNSWEKQVKHVQVSHWFYPHAVIRNQKREEEEYERLKTFENPHRFSGKLYSSASFPEHLKRMILLRDRYTCQTCLKLDPNIDVYHIIPLINGGITCFDNGKTMCRVCTKKTMN